VGIAATLGLLTLTIFVAAEFLVVPWVVAGDSMEPTLRQGDRVLVDRWTYRHRAARNGEIVLVRGPADVPMVKRVATPRTTEDADNGIWVLGDNTEHSVDSRRFGALPARRLRGRVIYRYWPPSRAGRVR
jgi:nickel-type superoxide dismutase maturation protease